MREDERDEKRAVNPARRKDAPARRPTPPPEEREAPEPPKGTQGAELNPRDEGGIAE